jgi:hypothetical protein
MTITRGVGRNLNDGFLTAGQRHSPEQHRGQKQVANECYILFHFSHLLSDLDFTLCLFFIAGGVPVVLALSAAQFARMIVLQRLSVNIF